MCGTRLQETYRKLFLAANRFFILKIWNIDCNFSDNKKIICEHAVFEIGKDN